MVTIRTVVVVVPLTILVSGHEADASRVGLRNATYGTDTIMLDDPPSILFVSVECAATSKFVELAHTLNHLQKLHYVFVDEAHLLLSDFRPVMKRLLPLWAVGCQLVTLTASLSPSQETNLKIVMSTTFTVIRMSTVRPLIKYVVDEVADVDDEIIRQLIECDALPSPGVNPLEGSSMLSCGIGTRKGVPDFQHYKGVEGHAKSPEIRLGRRTSRSSLILHPKQTTKWLVYIREHPWVLGQATGTLDHKTHHGPDSREATTFPHIVFSAPHFEDYIQMAFFPATPKLESRNCPEIVPVGVPGL
jgi:hypothetical protein